MFKRANKITSLLIAAAAVVSLVPASAADVKKIDSQDGTVYNAVAYKDGKFYVDGELEDKDEATYYVADGKFTELDDVDSGSDVTTYGTKYVNVESGDYFVDLEDGKVTDDSIKDDANDDAASALRKKIKNDNDGRYTDGDEVAVPVLTEIAGGKVFGDLWYKADYHLDSTDNPITTVFTDADGNYIDADYNLGKIKVSYTTGSSVNVENTKDTVDFGAKSTGKDAKDSLSTAIAPGIVLGQDKDYIYRLADITLTVASAKTNSLITEVYGQPVTDAGSAFTVGTSDVGQTVEFKVIQKISKAQDSEDVDGAKYAKNVTNYVISGDDAKTATLLGTTGGFNVTADGKITSYKVTGTNIKAETITLKAKSGLNYTDISDGDDTDLETATAFQFDVDGNLWALDGGYIKKYNNDDSFDKVYKVDGSFDKLSVYDKDNMVAWNEEDDVYSLIGSKDATETPETPVVTAGWVQATDGTWTYVKADGTKATGWLNLNGAWYFLKADGVMAKGWVQDGGSWYYLAGSGAMQTGWLNDNGTWYYLAGSGAMQTGWLNDNGTWYYLNASGAMLSNVTVDGYVLGFSGAWVK